MLLDHFRRMFDYNYWCNAHLMDTAANLSASQFEQETQFPLKSFKETLVHTLGAERIYRMRLAGELPSGLKAEDLGDLAAVRARWNEEEQLFRAYLDGIDEANLGESFTYTVASTGQEYTRRRADILTQLLFHGMQHRAEMAQMLTEFGHSPGDIDFMLWVNQP